MKKRAGDNWKDIVEYVGPLPLEMNPSKRARSSQTDVVTGAPDSCPSDIDPASSSYVRPPVNPGLDIGGEHFLHAHNHACHKMSLNLGVINEMLKI